MQLNGCDKVVVTLGLGFAVGAGCICRPAAKTILRLSRTQGDCRRASALGMRRVSWFENGTEIVILGYGWHPREEESYCFFLNEPYPDFEPRYLRITCKPGAQARLRRCKVQIILLSSSLPCGPPQPDTDSRKLYLYAGVALCRAHQQGARLSLTLKDVVLSRPEQPGQILTVDGEVLAERATPAEALDESDGFEAARRRAK